MQTLPHLIFLSLQIYDIISQNQTLQSFVAIISKILFYTNPLQETEPFSKHAHILYFSWKIRHTFFAEFKKCTTFASAIKQHGRLAQLVQSIWFTPRGSGVRIPQRPQKGSHRKASFFISPIFPGGGERFKTRSAKSILSSHNNTASFWYDRCFPSLSRSTGS